MLPMMMLVGVMFNLGWVYYASRLALAAFISLRIVQKRVTLFQNDQADATRLHKLAKS
jgi:hypothetical protein